MNGRVNVGLLGALALGFGLLAGGTAAQEIKPRTIKVGYGTAADHPFGLGVTRFAELVAKKTDGRLTVRGYPNGQLGAEVPSISSAQGGVLEMAVTSTSAVVGTVREFALFDLPYLFATEQEADAVLDGAVGRQLLDKLPAKGLIGLCYWESGFRNISNSRRPVTKSDDIRGLKIRTIQNPVFLDTVNAFGANAVPMPFTELYTALETKAIDGQEGPYTTILTSKLNEVQRYLSPTRHIYGAVVVLVGKKFWDQLGDGERRVLQDSCAEARDHERRVSRELSPNALAELKAKGMVFSEIPEGEMAEMRERAKPVADKFAEEIGRDLFAQAQAELAKMRQR